MGSLRLASAAPPSRGQMKSKVSNFWENCYLYGVFRMDGLYSWVSLVVGLKKTESWAPIDSFF